MDNFKPMSERESLAYQYGYKKGFEDGVLETLTKEKENAFNAGVAVGIEINTNEE